MHFAPHYGIISVDDMIDHRFENSSFCIFGFILPSIGKFLPPPFGICFHKVHGFTKQQKYISYKLGIIDGIGLLPSIPSCAIKP